MFQQLIALIKKDILIEYRQKHTIMGVILYVASTVFLLYMMTGQPEARIWNALFWVCELFITVNTIAKSFSQEGTGRLRYYYTIVSPAAYLLSKIIYNVVLMAGVSLVSLLLFRLLLGNPIHSFLRFFGVVMVGTICLSVLYTFLSAIAAQAKQNAALMAIMGFPTSIPVLMMLNKVTAVLVDNVHQEGWWQFMSFLGIISIMMIGIGLILFPFLWKE